MAVLMEASAWLICSPWQFRLCLVLSLLGGFYSGLANTALISDVGRSWLHHANLLVLILCPVWWVQSIGYVAFVDDVVNHSVKRWRPGYESPLHRVGWPAYWLRDQIAYRLPDASWWREQLFRL